VIASQGGTAGIRIATTAAYALPVALVGIVSPTVVDAFASYDRLEKITITAAIPVFQALQGLVISRESVGRGFGSRELLLVTGAVSALTVIGFAAIGPIAIAFLFSGTVDIELSTLALFAVAAGLAVANRGTQLMLANRVSGRPYATYIALSALGGASLVPFLSAGGMLLASVGVVASEAILLLVTVIVLHMARRRLRANSMARA
jgi:hypothetical protein